MKKLILVVLLLGGGYLAGSYFPLKAWLPAAEQKAEEVEQALGVGVVATQQDAASQALFKDEELQVTDEALLLLPGQTDPQYGLWVNTYQSRTGAEQELARLTAGGEPGAVLNYQDAGGRKALLLLLGAYPQKGKAQLAQQTLAQQWGIHAQLVKFPQLDPS